MEYNNQKLKPEDVVTLSGISDVGNKWLEDNGTEYEVVKYETWDKNRVLLRSIKVDCKESLFWIGMYPNPSNNLKIEKRKKGKKWKKI
tara:strand:+ start:125 stop:388 length:264 start_codon:yes stop_codon:yes gene_type:complete